MLVHVQNSPKQMLDVLQRSFGISNAFGGMWAVALRHLLQCVDWQRDLLTQELVM